MKVKLVFVPPGGGETDHAAEFDLPAIPQPGDYITIWSSVEGGTQDFIVRRTWWNLEFSATGQPVGTDGTVKMIAVECEFAKNAYSSESHKASCERYGASAFESTAY